MSELVKEVIPNCTLAELTALESIIGALAQDGKVLSVPGLVRLLMQDMCHYYKKLEDFQAAERARRRRQRAAGGPTAAAAAAGTETGADASDAAAMDVDASSAVAPAAAQDEGGLARSDLVAGLRHVFTLLSILSAAEPSAIKAPHVAVLVEVGLQSADLAVRLPCSMTWSCLVAPSSLCKKLQLCKHDCHCPVVSIATPSLGCLPCPLLLLNACKSIRKE